METRGRVALVTGAGRRVGKAVALALGQAGATVAVHYNTSKDGAEDTARTIGSAGGRARAIGADLASDRSLASLVPDVIREFGSLDILVNSASIFRDVRLFETTDAEWDENFRVNVRAPFVLSREMARALNGRPGKIVNLNDWKNARPKRFAYGVSKAALSGLTRSLALALAPAIQVNEVALGAILLPPGAEAAYEKVLASRAPAKRMGTPEEVAGAVLWLIGNDYVTGETVRVDGGQHLGRV
ncbi:MAG: SDR family oxidoreductase [Chloroflexi bacterium]|nr:SDR family oxidoreductase [Chloroflexota bacterium]